jgi:anti-sigma regulatory factor (Ser/Thr protein kinase)
MSRAADGAIDFNACAPATADGKARVLAALESFGMEHGWERAIRNELALILEEWLTNIISYSNAPAGSEISLRVMWAADDLMLELRDSGESFDPMTASAPDKTTRLEERRLGGYGVAMIKRLVDTMEWERIGGQNVLRLRKSARVPKLRS